MQAALKQAGIEEVTAALQEQFDALYKQVYNKGMMCRY